MTRPDRRVVRVAILLLVAAIAAIAQSITSREPGGTNPVSSGREPSSPLTEVAAAFAQRRSNVELTCAGRIERLLPDDDDGSAHQRFIVNVAAEQTVLVAHNLELAPRIPLALGDSVTVRGVYEWNEKGGVLHWTHDDPQGRRDGGWILHEGETYR